MFATENIPAAHMVGQYSSSALGYSVVTSWALDLYGDEIDERTHGFVFSSKISSRERTALISEKLRSRMWCDMDADFIEPEDFEPDLYDTVHFVDA